MDLLESDDTAMKMFFFDGLNETVNIVYLASLMFFDWWIRLLIALKRTYDLWNTKFLLLNERQYNISLFFNFEHNYTYYYLQFVFIVHLTNLENIYDIPCIVGV